MGLNPTIPLFPSVFHSGSGQNCGQSITVSYELMLFIIDSLLIDNESIRQSFCKCEALC